MTTTDMISASQWLRRLACLYEDVRTLTDATGTWSCTGCTQPLEGDVIATLNKAAIDAKWKQIATAVTAVKALKIII